MGYSLHLAKQNFSFAVSHFTIFGPKTAERMHGHNYRVSFNLSCESLKEDLGMAFDFNEIKPLLKQACDDLDEFILLPAQSPYLKITTSDHEVEVRFDQKRYLFPLQDVCLLPVANVTVEALASLLHSRIKTKLRREWKITKLAVTLEETPGQSVTFEE